MIYNLLQSIQLLGDVSRSFCDNCIAGLQANTDRIKKLLDKSLMLVTALTPKIGYDMAAKVAKVAHERNTTLKEILLEKGLMNVNEIDEALDPSKMIGSNK